MLNEKAVFEVGDIIHVRRNWNFKKLSAKEILDSVEYQKEFKTRYPELSKIVEKDFDEQKVLEEVLKNTELKKKPKETEEGFVFEISEEEFEKSIKKAIEISR
ncbi:MAG: hypothetical protein ACFFG0_02770 [Candidatus Thorarchaeota archaeon]